MKRYYVNQCQLHDLLVAFKFTNRKLQFYTVYIFQMGGFFWIKSFYIANVLFFSGFFNALVLILKSTFTLIHD